MVYSETRLPYPMTPPNSITYVIIHNKVIRRFLTLFWNRMTDSLLFNARNVQFWCSVRLMKVIAETFSFANKFTLAFQNIKDL